MGHPVSGFQGSSQNESMKSLFWLQHSLVLQLAYDVVVGKLVAVNFGDAESSGKDSGNHGYLNQLVSLLLHNEPHVPLH